MNSFNRTIVELKCLVFGQSDTATQAFNRTIVDIEIW